MLLQTKRRPRQARPLRRPGAGQG